jgi:uroporphyrinogen decarboxylase
MDYWSTEEATQKALKYLGCADRWELYEKLHIDALVTVGPEYVGPPLALDADMYGCRFRDVDYGGGSYRECAYHPLAHYSSIEEMEANYTWPSVDWFDYSVIYKQIEDKDEYAVRGGGSEPFLTYARLRGMQQAYMDLVLNPELVHYCLDKLYDFCYQNTQRIYEAIPGRVDISYVAEDMGSQEGLLFSPEQIKTFFIPRMRRMIELVHQAGARVFHHSDGAITKIIPDMIEAGIDILNPIQWRCKGMDRATLKRDFGNQVVFHGGIDNQQTLAFGDVKDVQEEVAHNIQILGQGGGYILAPCHNIQAISPPQNVVAMYETGYACGRM